MFSLSYKFIWLLLPTLLYSFESSGHLTVLSQPEGAEIWVSAPGKPRVLLGKTPLNYFELKSATYDMLLLLEDHDSLSIRTVEVKAGDHLKIEKNLRSRYGILKVNTSPDSGEIFMNDLKVGIAPYLNQLMIPGQYNVRIVHPSPLFRPAEIPLQITQGDTLTVEKQMRYRDKNFNHEHLSIPAWFLQAELGWQWLNVTGVYDSMGKTDYFETDAVQSQTLFPIILRLGLPHDLEFHLHLPFVRKKLSDSLNAIGGPYDLALGAKYTLRNYNAGLDVTYQFATGRHDTSSSGALNSLGSGRNQLAITAIAMMAKNKFQGFANAGGEFHFKDNKDAKLDYGEQLFAFLRVGYLLHPWLPYLALSGRYALADKYDGKSYDDRDKLPVNASLLGAHSHYTVGAELGVIVDATESFGIQAGLPFTLIGKNGSTNYWGFHLSVAYNIALY